MTARGSVSPLSDPPRRRPVVASVFVSTYFDSSLEKGYAFSVVQLSRFCLTCLTADTPFGRYDWRAPRSRRLPSGYVLGSKATWVGVKGCWSLSQRRRVVRPSPCAGVTVFSDCYTSGLSSVSWRAGFAWVRTVSVLCGAGDSSYVGEKDEMGLLCHQGMSLMSHLGWGEERVRKGPGGIDVPGLTEMSSPRHEVLARDPSVSTSKDQRRAMASFWRRRRPWRRHENVIGAGLYLFLVFRGRGCVASCWITSWDDYDDFFS